MCKYLANVKRMTEPKGEEMQSKRSSGSKALLNFIVYTAVAEKIIMFLQCVQRKSAKDDWWHVYSMWITSRTVSILDLVPSGWQFQWARPARFSIFRNHRFISQTSESLICRNLLNPVQNCHFVWAIYSHLKRRLRRRKWKFFFRTQDRRMQRRKRKNEEALDWFGDDSAISVMNKSLLEENIGNWGRNNHFVPQLLGIGIIIKYPQNKSTV